jgi:hypothetical protein
MRLTDRDMAEILVEREPAGAGVTIRIESTVGDDATVIHLSPDEARRLAALVLFQASKSGRTPEDGVLAFPDQVLKSA